MKTYLFKSLVLLAFVSQFISAHAFSFEEVASMLPESGPKISLDTDEFAELSRECDLDHSQAEDTKKKRHPCQNLLEAEKRFQALMNEANCESLNLYIPKEKEIRACQHQMRKSINESASQIQKYQEDIKNRDECIVKIQNNYCQKSAHLSRF